MEKSGSGSFVHVPDDIDEDAKVTSFDSLPASSTGASEASGGASGTAAQAASADAGADAAAVEELASRFVKAHVPLALPSRKILKQGPVLRKAFFFRKLEREAFLFNDIFVLAKVLFKDAHGDDQYEMKQVLHLESMRVTSPSSNILSVSDSNTEVTLVYSTSALKDEWLQAMRMAIKDAIDPTIPTPVQPVSSPSSSSPSAKAATLVTYNGLEEPIELVVNSLHWAACTGNHKKANKLATSGIINKKVDVNEPDRYGNSPVHYAASCGHLDIVKLLHREGADLTRKGAKQRTVTHCAARYARAGVLDYLMSRHDLSLPDQVNELDELKQTPLMSLCSSKALTDEKTHSQSAQCCRSLVRAGANPDEHDEAGHSLLHLVAPTSNTEFAAALVDGGAIPESIDRLNRTGLHVAAQAGSRAMVLFFLEHGVQPNGCDLERNTSLHLASTRVVGLTLLDHGARMNLKNKAGVAAGDHDFFKAAETDAAVARYSAAPKTIGDGRLDEWMPDPDSNGCTICFASFTVTNRRHHCRRCGLLICGLCSTKKFEIFDKGTKNVRCCDGCYNLLRWKQSTRNKPLAHARKAQTTNNLNSAIAQRAAALSQPQIVVSSSEPALAHMRQAADQRTKNLDAVDQKAQELGQEAADMANLTSKLKDQMASKYA